MTTPIEGRRERSRRLKHEAILDAAERLFRAHGFEGVTTQQIAAEADVSNGTLFRHARTKSDLLVTVVNRRLEHGRTQARLMSSQGADPVEAVLAMLAPLIDMCLARPSLVVAYQRELLFSSGREDDLGSVEELEGEVREILARAHPEAAPEIVATTATVVFATSYMELVRVGLGRAPAEHLTLQLRTTIRELVRALLVDSGRRHVLLAQPDL